MSCGEHYLSEACVFKVELHLNIAALSGLFCVLSFSYHKAVADMVADELEHALSVVCGVVYALNGVFLAEGIVLVELEDIAVYVAETGLVHLGDSVFGEIGVKFLGVVDIP